jgi:SpoVK/Ycf46/Vps4 family AAA+-type ATPase
MEPHTINLVATKSNRALTAFHAVLEAYGRKRVKADQRKILVVNGRDIPAPNVSWDEVILPPGLLEEIRTNVDGFFKSRERYRSLGIPYRRGFLFTGPPGCGKTLTLKAMASTIEATFITVLTRARVREGEVEYAFHLASKNVPAVLLFEDLDKLVNQSEFLSLSYFLNILDGLKVLDGVLVIATSNDPGKLDPALLHRPSRFDRVWKFPLPQYEQRLALLERKGAFWFSKAALEEAAHHSNGFSMAYVQEIIVNALLECAHADIVPSDAHLLKSVELLKAQRKSASKEEESLADRESLGFSPPPRGLREFMRLPEEDDDE